MRSRDKHLPEIGKGQRTYVEAEHSKAKRIVRCASIQLLSLT